jgi:hypothetical protein
MLTTIKLFYVRQSFHLQAHFLVSLCEPQLEQSLRFEEIISFCLMFYMLP